MKSFPLKLLAADKVFFDGQCTSLVVPVEDGQYGILADHSNVVLAIVPGLAEIKSGDEEILAVVTYGICKVRHGEVIMLVESCDNAAEVDEAVARRELEATLEIKERKKDRINIQNAEIKIAKALDRIRHKGGGNY